MTCTPRTGQQGDAAWVCVAARGVRPSSGVWPPPAPLAWPRWGVAPLWEPPPIFWCRRRQTGPTPCFWGREGGLGATLVANPACRPPTFPRGDYCPKGEGGRSAVEFTRSLGRVGSGDYFKIIYWPTLRRSCFGERHGGRRVSCLRSSIAAGEVASAPSGSRVWAVYSSAGTCITTVLVYLALCSTSPLACPQSGPRAFVQSSGEGDPAGLSSPPVGPIRRSPLVGKLARGGPRCPFYLFSICLGLSTRSPLPPMHCSCGLPTRLSRRHPPLSFATPPHSFPPLPLSTPFVIA